MLLVGFTCFCTPGMFSALNNLGAGGTQDITLSDTANGVLYGLFAATGFVSGGICNGTWYFITVLETKQLRFYSCSPRSAVDLVLGYAWLRALRRCPLVVSTSHRLVTSSRWIFSPSSQSPNARHVLVPHHGRCTPRSIRCPPLVRPR